MPATATRSHNRIAPYQTREPAWLVLPTTSAERQAVMADTFFTAILTLKSLMASDDPAMALRAAELIVDVEKTRMRHDRDLIGTSLTTPPELPPSEPVPSVEDSEQPASEGGVNLADPFEVFVSQVQAQTQAEMDQAGCEWYIVTREYARELAEDQIRCERIRRMNAASVSTPSSPTPVSVNLDRSP